MSLSGCIFCKIVAGTIPCARIYEDDQHLAFLDIGPINEGHALVIPKQHVDPLTAMDPEALAALARIVQRVAGGVAAATRADGFNLHLSSGACAGQVVPHVHFHVIPRFDRDGHSFHWRQGRYESPQAMEERARAIRSAIR